MRDEDKFYRGTQFDAGWNEEVRPTEFLVITGLCIVVFVIGAMVGYLLGAL